jgi:hypothetical protein
MITDNEIKFHKILGADAKRTDEEYERYKENKPW